MPSARHTAVIDAPARAVWEKLGDFESWPKWLRVPWADRSVTLDPPGAVEIGSSVVLRGRLPYRLFARVVEFDRDRRLALEIERSEYPSDRLLLGRARYTIEIEPLDGASTRVTAMHEVEGRGWPGRVYMSTVFRPFMRSNVRSIVRSIAEVSRAPS